MNHTEHIYSILADPLIFTAQLYKKFSTTKPQSSTALVLNLTYNSN